jgi:hypothetical protein
MHLVVRGAHSLADLTAATREAIQPIDPSLPFKKVHAVQEIVDKSLHGFGPACRGWSASVEPRAITLRVNGLLIKMPIDPINA